MNRVWALGVITLASCSANAPASAPSGARASETPATRAPVPGASNPHECEDAPSAEPKLESAPIVGENALVALEQCTRKLAKPGKLGITLLFDEGSITSRPFITHSTVSDCGVVECVKNHLRELQRPALAEMDKSAESLNLALTPHGAVQRIKEVDWARDKSQACVDPSDEPAAFMSARMSPETIQRIVRERYQDFRKCYEGGLASNPNLSGRVSIRFVIELDGHVSHAYIQDNELPDCRVAQCVRAAMTQSVFPKPKQGIVKVVYPIMLSPG